MAETASVQSQILHSRGERRVERGAGELARLVDIGVGGVRFEIEREQPLPSSFTVKVEAPDVSASSHSRREKP